LQWIPAQSQDACTATHTSGYQEDKVFGSIRYLSVALPLLATDGEADKEDGNTWGLILVILIHSLVFNNQKARFLY